MASFAVIGLLILVIGVYLVHSAGFMRGWPSWRWSGSRLPDWRRSWRLPDWRLPRWDWRLPRFALWALLIVFCGLFAGAGLLVGSYVSPGPSTVVGAAVQTVQTVTGHQHQSALTTTTITTTKTIKRNGKTLTVPVTTTQVLKVPAAIRTNTVNRTDTINHTDTVNHTVTSTVTVPVTSTITETVTETVTQTTPPTT